jgi:hypothetical protein
VAYSLGLARRGLVDEDLRSSPAFGHSGCRSNRQRWRHDQARRQDLSPWGIDAPESKQWCGDYPAGVMATGTLEMLIKGKTVVCEPKATDRYGRTVAICRADGEDLGRTMVQLGMAWAFVRYSRDYVDQEARARAENLGVHAYPCVVAWEWRAQQRH